MTGGSLLSSTLSQRPSLMYLLLSLIFPFVSLIGCGLSPADALVVGKCKVMISGQPASEVRVLLQAADGASVRFEGVTDALGIAVMHLSDGSSLPSGSEVEMKAAVESLGDWSIAPPWSDIEKTPLVITWMGSDAVVEIEVPQEAVKTL